MRLITELFRSLSEFGVIATLMKVISYPGRKLRWRRILSADNLEDRFTQIFSTNAWQDDESVSGTGSSIQATKGLGDKISTVLKDLNIRRLFDAPCGDFNWMNSVVQNCELEYLGVDIVEPLIERNSATFGGPAIKFKHMDITKDSFPDADLMICRDCLFHLSFADTEAVLSRFIDSNIAFLLTTTHVNDPPFDNEDIDSGDFRRINLFGYPFDFPRDPLARIDDWNGTDPRKELCLWSRVQILSRYQSKAGIQKTR